MTDVPKDIMEAAEQYASFNSITAPYRSYVVSAYIAGSLAERERRTTDVVTLEAAYRKGFSDCIQMDGNDRDEGWRLYALSVAAPSLSSGAGRSE